MNTVLEIISRIYTVISEVMEAICNTADTINSVDFGNTLFAKYMGYFHYVVGSPNYEIFTTLVLIGAGISLFGFILKGIGLLKNLLPW